MYVLKRIWLEFRDHMGKYIYVWLQFVVVIYILSSEVAGFKNSYEFLHFVKDYSEDLYMYDDVLGYAFENSMDTSQFLAEIEEINGVRGVGYKKSIMGYDIVGENGMGDLTYINDIMSEISYTTIEGEWLTEAEQSEEHINVVVSYQVGQMYDIGDTFEIEYTGSDIKHLCKVVGIQHEGKGMLSMNVGGSFKILYQDSSYEWDIITNDKRVLNHINQEECIYSDRNAIIALEEGFDEAQLKKYGNIYSIKYMENVNEKHFTGLLYDFFDSHGVVLFAVLFGSFAVIYLILSKGMYKTGVYALLGQTRWKRVTDNLLIHLFVYVSAVVTAYLIYLRPVSEEMMEMHGKNVWTSWNTVFVIILGMVTSMITIVTSICMIRKCPKDIMSVAKNMEG